MRFGCERRIADWLRAQRIELRAEAFNLLNTPAFSNPDGVVGSPSFGSITAAFDPRVIQLAVKYGF